MKFIFIQNFGNLYLQYFGRRSQSVRSFEVCLIRSYFPSLLQNSNNQVAIAGQNQVSGAGETQGGPNTVLRVIVEHLLYPITLDILYQVSERTTRYVTAGSFIISSFYIESGRSRYAECSIACNVTMNYIHIQVRTRIYTLRKDGNFSRVST